MWKLSTIWLRTQYTCKYMVQHCCLYNSNFYGYFGQWTNIFGGFNVCQTRELRVCSNVTRWIQNCLHNVNHTSLIVLNSLHDKSIHVSSIGLNIRLSSAAGNSVMSFNMLLFSFNDVPWYLSSCPERSGFFPGSISRASSLGSSDVEYILISLLAHQVLSCPRNTIDHS